MKATIVANHATVISWIVAAITAAVVEAFSGSRYGLPVIVILILIVTWAAMFFLPLSIKPLGKGKVFMGVARLGRDDAAWPRSEAEQVIRELKSRPKTASLLCGPSGSGKSTLVRHYVIPSIEAAGWTIVAPGDFATLRTQLLNGFLPTSRATLDELASLEFQASALGARKKTLLVLDQSEQLLNSTADDVRWIASFLAKCFESPDTRLLICVRSDYYLPLKHILGSLVPDPDSICWLRGFALSGADGIAIRESLRAVVASDSLVDRIVEDLTSSELVRHHSSEIARRDSVLPLELQMIGRVLEIEKSRGRSVDEALYIQRLHRARGTLHRYFALTLRASPNFDVALAVLCALSVSTARGSLSLKALAAVTCYSVEQIRDCLRAMEVNGLVLEPRSDVFEWVHDYLATAFRDFTATVMNPIRRDNILFLAERSMRYGTPDSGILPANRASVKSHAALAIFAIVFFIVVARMLTDRPFATLRLYAPSFSRVDIDKFYPAFGLAQLTWAVFVYQFMRLFLRLRRGALLFPWVMGVIGVAVVAVTAVWPSVWLFAIAAVAFLIAAKFCLMASNWSVPPQARRMIGGFGMNCFVVSSVCVGGGWLWLYLWPTLALTGWEKWLAWGTATAVISLAFIAVMRHATEESLARWLGVLDRSYK